MRFAQWSVVASLLTAGGVFAGPTVIYRPYYVPRLIYRPYYPTYAGPYLSDPAAAYAPPLQVFQPGPVPIAAPGLSPQAGPGLPIQAGPGLPNFGGAVPRIAPQLDEAALLETLLQQLSSPRERDRIDAASTLGRNRVARAVGPLSKALANDASPRVREAAARALGLIGQPAALNALQNAAQADDDRDVRHSAQFAAEVIQANLGRK